jgi:hypothetical protein
VVALAFGAFLSDQGYDFVLELAAGTTAAPCAPFLVIGPPYGGGGTIAGWQHALYFLLHLVPVDDVVRLLHQLQRWEGSTAERRETATLQAVLSLYVDMHDAKFEGGGFVQAQAFKEFYESPDDFDRIFPVLYPDELRLCRRGLREILRFGHLQPLRPVFAAQRITPAQAEDYLIANATDKGGTSPIARLQREREVLHALWVRKGRDFAEADRSISVRARTGCPFSPPVGARNLHQPDTPPSSARCDLLAIDRLFGPLGAGPLFRYTGRHPSRR